MKINTVYVPYVPGIDEDVRPPEYFHKTVTTFGKNMPDIKDFELREIQGTRLVYCEDTGEWVDLGHQAVYKRKAVEE